MITHRLRLADAPAGYQGIDEKRKACRKGCWP